MRKYCRCNFSYLSHTLWLNFEIFCEEHQQMKTYKFNISWAHLIGYYLV